MAYNAELQMLREFAWFWMPRINCYFCGKPLMAGLVNPSFGHRRHPKVRAFVTVHHDDEDRGNNSNGNLKWCHRKCHRNYHKQLLLKGGPHGNEENEEGEEGEQEIEERVLTGGDPNV